MVSISPRERDMQTLYFQVKKLKIELYVRFQLKELKYLTCVFILNWRNPTTPQHSDSHPCTSRPLGGHECFWGTRVVGHFVYFRWSEMSEPSYELAFSWHSQNISSSSPAYVVMLLKIIFNWTSLIYQGIVRSHWALHAICVFVVLLGACVGICFPNIRWYLFECSDRMLFFLNAGLYLCVGDKWE